MIRVIAGKNRGTQLAFPKVARPITDRIKTSIFDLIRNFIPGARVLDLYSGSGSFGIEALSRGAISAIMVEKDEQAAGVIAQNIARTRLEASAKVIKQDAGRFLDQTKNDFDLIMLDPPFPFDELTKTRILFAALKVLSEQGILIFRYPTKEIYLNIPKSFTAVYTQKYGISTVTFYRKKPALVSKP